MRYTFSGSDHIALDLPRAMSVLAIIFASVYVLFDELPRKVMIFLPVYFLLAALLNRVSGLNQEGKARVIIVNRIVAALVVAICTFAIFLVQAGIEGREAAGALNLEIAILLLLTVGMLGIYDDWRGDRLSVSQPLFVGALGWGCYLLLWRVAIGVCG